MNDPEQHRPVHAAGPRIMCGMTGRNLSDREQRLAALDGKRGHGGCDYCVAEYEWIYAGEGIAHLRVEHAMDCPIVIERMRQRFIRGPYRSNADPGDEQP